MRVDDVSDVHLQSEKVGLTPGTLPDQVLVLHAGTLIETPSACEKVGSGLPLAFTDARAVENQAIASIPPG